MSSLQIYSLFSKKHSLLLKILIATLLYPAYAAITDLIPPD